MNNFTKLSLLLLVMVGLWQPLSAQRSVGAQLPALVSGNGLTALANLGGNRGVACDTLSNNFTTDSVIISGINNNWGYVSGHNEFEDVAKADFFTYTGTGEITSAYIYFARAFAATPTSTVRVTIWDDNGTAGAPGTILGFEDVLINTLTPDVLAQDLSEVVFSTPVTVNGNYYLGVQLDYTLPIDTIAIYTTENPRLAGPINTAWEQWSDLSWNTYTFAWTYNTSHWIFPVVCPLPAAPVANFSGTPTTLTAGGSVNFTDLSSGTPTSWSWSFPNGTPNSANTQTPPAIVYNTPGTYDVSLTVTNGNGTDTETKTGYIQVNSGGGSNTYVDCDTFANFNFATATEQVYPSDVWGYVAGHNVYGDTSKADGYVNQLVGSPVSGAVIFFSVAATTNPNATINVKVWDANGTGGLPGTVLATEAVTISSIIPNANAGLPTFVNFTNPATPTGNYYVGISFQYAAGDTIAIYTNTDSAGPNSAFEQWNDGTWHAYSESPGGWGLDLSHYIFPIQCATVPCPTLLPPVLAALAPIPSCGAIVLPLQPSTTWQRALMM